MLVSILNNEIDENTFLYEYNANLMYKRLPKRIYGFVLKYRDLFFIVINWNLSKEKKKMTILHEFAHIELSHLEKRKELLEFSIENAEDEADKYINFLIEEIQNV